MNTRRLVGLSSLGFVLLGGGCGSGSSATSFSTSVAQICVGTCPVPPLVSISECIDPLPQYLSDGTPTYCTYGVALNRVADGIKACTKGPGVVQVTYLFDNAGLPRNIRADLDCERCELPRGRQKQEVLRCVENVAATARLPLGPNKQQFAVVFPYRLGEPLDPRLSPGYSPMDGLVQ